MFKMMINLSVTIFAFLSGTNAYNIHDYGWEPYTPGGLGFTNFGGGTDGPYYQYEATYSRDCGLGCTQYARASDFETLDSRHTHRDYDRHYDHDRHYDYDRSYNHDIHLGPD